MKQSATKRRKHPEDDLQRQIWRTIQALGIEKRCIVFHVPNGGARNSREAARFKGMGVLAGVADFVFLADGHRCFCMELKAGPNKLSEKQKVFRERCAYHGIPYVIVRSLDEALEHLREWRLIDERVHIHTGRIRGGAA